MTSHHHPLLQPNDLDRNHIRMISPFAGLASPSKVMAYLTGGRKPVPSNNHQQPLKPILKSSSRPSSQSSSDGEAVEALMHEDDLLNHMAGKRTVTFSDTCAVRTYFW